jgi:ubiquinone/menaquinone biosynthesis C-methylase UbiE
MIDIAREKAATAGVTNVDFQQSSVGELDVAPRSKDVVLGLSILHLLRDRDAAMKKVHAWLKPGGLFVTSTVCAGDMGFATKLLIKTVMPMGQFMGFIPNFYAFTKDELRTSFKQAGFSIEYEWQPPEKKDSAVFIIGKKESN